MIASGWRPGFSTDYDAVLLARNFNTKTILNLTNTKYVYDKDPAKHMDAKPIKSLSWRDFRKIVGDVWKPGMNAPFDPVASKLAERLHMKVIIMSGLSSLDNFLSGKNFNGTVIR